MGDEVCRETAADPFAIGRNRQSMCRLGVPCVMPDCQGFVGNVGPESLHFFAPDGYLYEPVRRHPGRQVER